MEPTVLDATFKAVAILDSVESLIWTDRYCGWGDFEILTPITTKILTNLRSDYYLKSDDSDHQMIIEDMNIQSDEENGNKFLVKGRSLESILERRRIWNRTVFQGSLEAGVEKLLNENVINPINPDRKIPNFVFVLSSDPFIESLWIDVQYEAGRTSVYSAIFDICQSNNLGFKVFLDDSNNFVFQLYSGTDRSYDQLTNPTIEFSHTYDNIINSEYTESKRGLKTVSLVAGEEKEGEEQLFLEVQSPMAEGSGLLRREMFTDATGITKTPPDQEPLTDAEYIMVLAQKGTEDLLNNPFNKEFEGQVDTASTYVYGTDFFMGDVVQIVDEYGHEAKSRMIELIHSQDTSGVRTYPTFISAGSNIVRVKNVQMVCHFDGPEPYNKNFTGNPNGNNGQVPTVNGGVIYRPGKFGKAIQLGLATTNLVQNPSGEVNLNGWGADPATGVGPIEQSGDFSIFGTKSVKVSRTNTGGSGYLVMDWDVPFVTGNSYTVSGYARKLSGLPISAIDIPQIYVNDEYVAVTQYLDVGGGWYRFISAPRLSPTTKTNYVSLQIMANSNSNETLYIDGVQVEEKAYATPYCDGSLGTGHSWSGTPHASTSSRTNGYLTYPVIPPQDGSISMWLYSSPSVLRAGDWIRLFAWPNDAVSVYINNVGYLVGYVNNIGRGTGVPLTQDNFAYGTWHHIIFSWTEELWCKMFLDGIKVDQGSAGAPYPCDPVLTLGGSTYNYGDLIDDFAIVGRAIDEEEALQIYQSGLPIFPD